MIDTSMHALITGGAGFIGSHLVDALMREGYKVTVFDNLITGNIQNLNSYKNNKFFKFLKGDVRDQTTVLKAMKKIDIVFHLAADLQEGGGIKNPLSDFETNVRGTFNVLLAARKLNVKKVVFSSSVMVYGGRDTLSELPISEDDKVKLVTPYGVSKFTGENYCLLFNRLYKLNTVILRYFNVYGSRVRLDSPYLGVVNKFVQSCLKGEQMMIYGDGQQTRDFVDVRDVVNATILAAVKDSVVGEIINVGSGVATTINKLASAIQSIFSTINEYKILPLIHSSSRPNEAYRNAQADLKKAKKVLGYKPKISIKRGLMELINFYRTQDTRNQK